MSRGVNTFLNCAAPAARRVLAPAGAVTIKLSGAAIAKKDDSITVGRDIVGAVVVLLLHQHGFPRWRKRDYVTGPDSATRASAAAGEFCDHARTR